MQVVFLFLIAVILEVTSLVFLKETKNIYISLFAIFGLILSYFIFQRVLQLIPLNVAYAIWAGLGIVLTYLVGRFFLAEVLLLEQILFIFIILVGIVGLAYTSV